MQDPKQRTKSVEDPGKHYPNQDKSFLIEGLSEIDRKGLINRCILRPGQVQVDDICLSLFTGHWSRHCKGGVNFLREDTVGPL